VTVEGTLLRVGVNPVDALLSLLDVAEPVCAPPELCTTPERGSAVEGRRCDEMELVPESTELCASSDVEAGEEPVTESDDVVEEVDSVDDVLAADPDEELDVDDFVSADEESDDELEELVSFGSANATPGVVATAAPTPIANARTLARTMDCASTGIPPRG
jgi:hypothetical protein